MMTKAMKMLAATRAFVVTVVMAMAMAMASFMMAAAVGVMMATAMLATQPTRALWRRCGCGAAAAR